MKVKVQDKLKILTLYIHSQVTFELKIYNFPLTWVDQTVDALCFKYVRKWKELPINACLKELFILPKSKGGLGYHSFKTLSEKMRLIKRNAMLHSTDSDISRVKAETDIRFVESEVLLSNCPSMAQATAQLKQNQQASAW